MRANLPILLVIGQFAKINFVKQGVKSYTPMFILAKFPDVVIFQKIIQE